MSLINDALKRAKEVHRQNPPAPPSGPPLRPVERQPQQHPHLGLLLVFAVVVAGAAILLWQGLQQWRAPRATDSPTHTAAPVAAGNTVAPGNIGAETPGGSVDEVINPRCRGDPCKVCTAPRRY